MTIVIALILLTAAVVVDLRQTPQRRLPELR